MYTHIYSHDNNKKMVNMYVLVKVKYKAHNNSRLLSKKMSEYEMMASLFVFHV